MTPVVIDTGLKPFPFRGAERGQAKQPAQRVRSPAVHGPLAPGTGDEPPGEQANRVGRSATGDCGVGGATREWSAGAGSGRESGADRASQGPRCCAVASHAGGKRGRAQARGAWRPRGKRRSRVRTAGQFAALGWSWPSKSAGRPPRSLIAGVGVRQRVERTRPRRRLKISSLTFRQRSRKARARPGEDMASRAFVRFEKSCRAGPFLSCATWQGGREMSVAKQVNLKTGCRDRCSAPSIAEGDVAGRNVHHVVARCRQCAHDGLDLRPVCAELFAFSGFPLGPNLLRELRPNAGGFSGEVQHQRPPDDGHFDHAQLVVEADQLRHVEAEDFADTCLTQPLIDLPLPQVRFGRIVDFDGSFAGFEVRVRYRQPVRAGTPPT